MIRKTIFFSGTILSIMFGCTKDESPNQSLSGQWSGNDTHTITMNGDAISHQTKVFDKEMRSTLILNTDGSGTLHEFKDGEDATSVNFIYSTSGNELNIKNSESSTTYQFTIQAYQSLVRLTLSSRTEMPNGIKTEIRQNFLRK